MGESDDPNGDPIDRLGLVELVERVEPLNSPRPTVKLLAAAVDRSAFDLLRASRPTPTPSTPVMPAPPSSEDDPFGDPFARTETPHTVVLPSVVHADRGTLTILAGIDAGASFTLDGLETVIGRDESATLLINDPSISRRHARITRDGNARHFIEDLGSTNGTFVCGRRVRRSALTTGDRVQLGRDCLMRFALVDEEEEAFQRRLYEASTQDTLTKLPNRRCLIERLAGEISHAHRGGNDVGLLMIDIDHFKGINDKFGHVAGDQVLRAIAQAGAKAVRASDVFARYGGEEFVVVARDTGKADAAALAERLRRAIRELRVEVGSGSVVVTVSIGIAVLSECERGDDGRQLFARADSRLYAAKVAGRDRMCDSP
jgi:diguanylate cyclase (GGDEF)-like protein